MNNATTHAFICNANELLTRTIRSELKAKACITILILVDGLKMSFNFPESVIEMA